jgi:hypothetical protein
MQGLVVVSGCDSPEYDCLSIKKSHLNPSAVLRSLIFCLVSDCGIRVQQVMQHHPFLRIDKNICNEKKCGFLSIDLMK